MLNGLFQKKKEELDDMLIEKERTRTVSFRVPESTLIELEKEATTKLGSTNSLINKILLQYVQWDRYEERMKMYPLPAECLQHILEHLDDVTRCEVVDIIFNSIRDWALVSKKKFDIHSTLQVLEDYCRMVNITIEDTISDGLRSYVIRHNLGKNVSLIVSELVTKIFWEVAKIKTETQMTHTTTVVKLTSKFD